MRSLFIYLTSSILLFASNCSEEPDCNHFMPITATHVPFMFIDSMTNENLVKDGFSDNPKRIPLDSVILFNVSMDTLPPNQWVVQDSYYGYIFFIYVFDQSKVPQVDTSIPGSMTYFLSSGNSDLDTIVFNYHFELKKKCYSITNDTLHSFINGRPAEFSAKSPVTDVFVIKK